MKPKGSSSEGEPALGLIEEAIHLLRDAPLSLHLIHLVGSLPFTLGLLWFWSDMSRGAHADHRLAPGALVMSLLYLVMKTAHAVHCAELRARLKGVECGRWSSSRLIRLLATQAPLQPLVFFLLPLTLFPLLLIPFPWVLAWFNGVSVCGDAAQGSPMTCARRALGHALAWPGQNHGLVGLLLILGTGVLVDVAVAVAALPYLLEKLLGLTTDFTLSTAAFFNSTFLLAIVALAYLVFDPLLKALYTLRGFKVDAIQTGADLRARLSTARAASAFPLALAALLWFLPASSPAHGQAPPTESTVSTPSLEPQRLESDLRRVLSRPDYQWRAPRELSEADPDPGEGPIRQWLRKQFKSLGEFFSQNLSALFSAIGRLLQRLFAGMKGPSIPTGNTRVDWISGFRILIYALLAAGIGIAAWYGWRLWSKRNPSAAVLENTPATTLPDLTADQVSADQLPEDGWLAMASDLATRAEWRLALRALYLGSLAHLAHRGLVRLAPAKSNRDYIAELRRRARSQALIPEVFTQTAHRFDRVWYGRHQATPELFEAAHSDLDTLRRIPTP